MLIRHKRVASNEAAVLQACHVSDVHATMQPHRQCLSYQCRERLCAAELIIHSYLPLLVSQTPSLGSDASPPLVLLYVFGIILHGIIQNNSYCLH